jgi:hypothetical protein
MPNNRKRSIRTKFNTLLMVLERLRCGGLIDNATVDYVRMSLVGGVLIQLITDPAGMKADAKGIISDPEWIVFLTILRQLSPEILSHEEFDKIADAIAGPGFRERMDEQNRDNS